MALGVEKNVRSYFSELSGKYGSISILVIGSTQPMQSPIGWRQHHLHCCHHVCTVLQTTWLMSVISHICLKYRAYMCTLIGIFLAHMWQQICEVDVVACVLAHIWNAFASVHHYIYPLISLIYAHTE